MYLVVSVFPAPLSPAYSNIIKNAQIKYISTWHNNHWLIPTRVMWHYTTHHRSTCDILTDPQTYGWAFSRVTWHYDSPLTHMTYCYDSPHDSHVTYYDSPHESRDILPLTHMTITRHIIWLTTWQSCDIWLTTWQSHDIWLTTWQSRDILYNSPLTTMDWHCFNIFISR